MDEKAWRSGVHAARRAMAGGDDVIATLGRMLAAFSADLPPEVRGQPAADRLMGFTAALAAQAVAGDSALALDPRLRPLSLDKAPTGPSLADLAATLQIPVGQLRDMLARRRAVPRHLRPRLRAWLDRHQPGPAEH